MAGKYYRGYILCRLNKIGSEWEVVKGLKEMNSDFGEDLKVTYASPIYGAWDLIIEASFEKLENLDKLVTMIRINPVFQKNIGETTTFVSSKPDFPWD
ncbi:MAG: hypothetical protein ACTSVI_16460 [Promethearchaeota archaeon]